MENKQLFQVISLLQYCTIPVYIIEYYFYKNFLGFKGRSWKFFFSAAVISGIDALFMKMGQGVFEIFVHVLIWFVTICILCKGDIFVKLYAVIVQDAITLLISLSFLTFDFGIIPILSNVDLLFRGSVVLVTIKNMIMDGINCLILFLFLRTICKLLNLKGRKVNVYQSLYLLIPCLASYSLAVIFFIIQTIKIGDEKYYLPYLFPKIYYVLPFVSFALLASIVITAYTFKKMLEGEEEKQINLIMEQQFKHQLDHSKNMEGFYSGVRSIMHDMNNHLACLKILAENNNVEEIKKYLISIGQTISKMDFEIKTGNAISDAVINEKYTIAKEEGIEFICDFMLPKEITLEPIDLCVILGNSLDNAIEACRKIPENKISKVITLKSYMRSMYLIVEISNASVEKLLYNGNQILSTKLDKQKHGMGIANIERVIKKYNGIMDIVEEKNEFSMNIMLKIK